VAMRAMRFCFGEYACPELCSAIRNGKSNQAIDAREHGASLFEGKKKTMVHDERDGSI
jgi:hypothetical protein